MQEALLKATRFFSIQGQMRREKELRTRGMGNRRKKGRAKPPLRIILSEVLKAFLYKVRSFNWIQTPGIGNSASGRLWETKSLFLKMKKILFFCEVFSILNSLDSPSIHLPDNIVTMGKTRPDLTYSLASLRRPCLTKSSQGLNLWVQCPGATQTWSCPLFHHKLVQNVWVKW